ncbi:MAG: hypothetical protein KAH09_07455 [Desulfobacula sp.]|nr:hypothetical protein [Desulfobacula sp.]
MNSRNAVSATIYSIAVMLILSGCTSIRPDINPLLDQKAAVLSRQAKSFNQHIIASKGTGWARLDTKTRTDKYKIAWAAVSPNKIRITFLLSGLPVETIVTNGEKIIFVSHTRAHARYSYTAKDPDMKNYIRVPVKLSEMISLLLGRLPVRNFDDAYFSASDSSLSTITLKQNWKRIKQTLHFNSKGKVNALKSTNAAGKILYEIRLIKYTAYALGDIPTKIEIKDMANNRLMIDIESFVPNPPIKESVFQLTESG